MSRSNPESSGHNPSQRWYEWQALKGTFSYWDKEAKQNVEITAPLTFCVLDYLASVTGFNELAQNGIYSNEVKITQLRKVPLKVCVHKAPNALAEGFWQDIKADVKQAGGRFTYSMYILTDIDGEPQIANVRLLGAALGAWMEFADNINIYDGGIAWNGECTEGKKGAVKYLMPVFEKTPISDELAALATEKDGELQEYFAERSSEKPEAPTDRSGTTFIPDTVEDLEEDSIPF